MSIRRLHLVALLLLIAVASTQPLAARDSVQSSRGTLTLPTYPWAAVKHPYFRGTDRVNIYPYPMLDFLSREQTNRTYRTVVLENEYLRLTFLPELGGKIHEVIDKTTGQPVFYVNHVIKPALIGQCGAWTSGGVEWNTGPQGHTVGCMQPVDVLILPRAPDGSQSVAIGETERIYGTQWTVVVTLRPGRAFIEERIRIYNPTETIRPYYFWNCTAAPNTKGFRFIYPMTLGTDHGAEKFFHWPIHDGKDLTRGTNYQDASSIFAWHCDQDFFGSYNDDLDRGVVAYANHHQLPGKKAWTWGWGSYGTLHQMDLTDNDGPYNEVQTGPLLTQGEVGRLDPSEAVEWQEWWYPIHGLGGFTFANRDVAVNAAAAEGKLHLRLMGSGNWDNVEALVSRDGRQLAQRRCAVMARQATDLELEIADSKEPVQVELRAARVVLARFRWPLDLPLRRPPEQRPAPQTAAELAQAGWQDFLFARPVEAEAKFRQALEKDPKSSTAQCGLAYLNLDRDPAAAQAAAQAALAVDPDRGLAHWAAATARLRSQADAAALDAAWAASLDPATAIPGRALAAELLIRQGKDEPAARALSEPGPWQTDPTCRNLLAFVHLQRGEKIDTIRLARENLKVDPLDAFSESLLWLARPGTKGLRLSAVVEANPQAVVDLAAKYVRLGQEAIALRVIEMYYTAQASNPRSHPIPFYWAGYLADQLGQKETAVKYLREARTTPVGQAPPHRYESLAVLRWAVEQDPRDGQAALCLGHLLFHLGRHAEGRAMWQKAAALGTEPVIAYRALGMAAKTLDNDPPAARDWLTKANQVDPKDCIVARDLARVLFELSDKAGADADKRALTTEARDRLQGAFEEGKGRSDFVALLARSHSRLGDDAATAKLLDSVRITIWEGAREAHDLFEEAHLALGEAQLKAGRAAEALAEFDRALEYPANLATGKLENTREAHIHYLRGNALAALGRQADAVAAWQRAADEPGSGNAKQDEARAKAKASLGVSPHH